MIELVALAYITCADLRVIDGNTIKCDGQNMRLLGDGEPYVSGVDAAEISRAKCEQEKRLGQDAKKRLQQLVKMPGIKIEDSRAVDSSDRPLIRIRLPNGKDSWPDADRRRLCRGLDAGLQAAMVQLMRSGVAAEAGVEFIPENGGDAGVRLRK